MAKKATDTEEKIAGTTENVGTAENAAVTVKATEKSTVASAAAEANASGFYCYIGPNLKNLIQTGTICRGTREEALNKAAEAIAQYPLVKTLIVSGDALPSARIKVKTPGNVLYANYRKLAGKEDE